MCFAGFTGWVVRALLLQAELVRLFFELLDGSSGRLLPQHTLCGNWTDPVILAD